MAKVGGNPFKDLLALRDRMNHLFEESLGRFTSPGEATAEGFWSPSVDIFEDRDKVVFRADLPGFRGEDVTLDLEDGNLVLRGERPMDPDVRQEDYHRLERPHGPFRRSFRLPAGVDTEHIQAVMREGVLTISLSKREDARARKVQIRVD